jgi:hypothetical protein
MLGILDSAIRSFPWNLPINHICYLFRRQAERYECTDLEILQQVN